MTPPLPCAVPSLRSSKPPAVITEPKAIGELLRAIDGYQGYLVTKCALRIAPLVFVRPGELRKAEWAEIDLDKAEWNIPADRCAYNRTAHLAERRKMMQQWADYLDKLKASADVIPFRRSG